MVVERGVHVPDKVVSLVDSLPDGLVDAGGLHPRFTVRVVDMRVGAEEGEVGAKLVELDGEGVSWVTVKSWNVSTTERHPGQSVLQHHDDGAL